MTRYLIQRLALTLPVLLGVSVIVFLVLRLVPGDPASVLLGSEATPERVEQLRRDLGLDQPLVVQYGIWLAHLARGDLGRSFTMHAPVLEQILDRFRNTLLLTLTGLAFATVVGGAAGVVAAAHHNSWLDRGLTVVTLFGVSMPVFWVGLMFVLLFAVAAGWFPSSGMSSTGRTDLPDLLSHLALPALTVGIATTGTIARFTRSSMLEALTQDYVRTARAKGLSERDVHARHVLRNALVPILTVVGIQLGYLLGGAVLTETVFSWPGLGRLMLDAILGRDFPLVQGAVLLIALVFVLVNLLVDVLYAYVDPRIRYA